MDRPRSPWARWSYATGPARLRLRCDGRTRITTLSSPIDAAIRQWSDPLDALRWLAAQATEAPMDGPPFKGGWIGWLSYDLGRLFEVIPARHPADEWPLFEFTFHADGVAYEHAEGRYVSFRCAEHCAQPAFSEWPAAAPPLAARPFVSNFDRLTYESTVARAIAYIRAGDIFQVNLSRRFSGAVALSAVEVYRLLRGRSPALFGACFRVPEYALICNSPELFLRVTPERDGSGRRRVVTRPIKGTRPRGLGMDAALRDSAKDQAELNMIIDLERNDLGRVCTIGSVRVTEPRTIEAHPSVYHGVATVEGTLCDDVTFVDLLRATFPGGSITGAPKIRAMEIIEELEPCRRGPYCGAIGYLSLDGHIEFNIAIRTILMKDGLVHVPAGGGIVADSNPADEYAETLVKARALFAALGADVSAEA